MSRRPRPFTLQGLAPTALLAGTLFLLGGMTVEFMHSQEKRRQDSLLRQQVTSQAGEVRALLEAELNASLHLTAGLVTYIQANRGRIRTEEIEPWLRGLVERGRHIRNIGIAPGNRISYIYPLAGNEGALGLYYPDNPAQWPDVERAIEERRPILAGPIPLKQGGRGLIYRVPVFLDDNRYWGIISTVINADQLLGLATHKAADLGLDIVVAPASGKPSPQAATQGEDGNPSVRLEVTVPGGTWLLTASASAERGIAPHAFLRHAGWLVSLFLAGLVFLLLRAQAKRAAMLLDLAASRQRFSRAFETAPQGMALLDLEGRWLDANDALCRLLGYGHDELKTRACADLIHPRDAQRHAKALAELTHEHSQSEHWEVRFLDKEGASIDCLFSVAWVDSQPPYLIAQIQDLRESKRLERMKNEFVSTVSHELRTPLTSISGSLGLLHGGAFGELPNEVRPLIEVAYRNSQSLTELINDLLDMEKLTAGKMTFDLRAQLLQPLLEEALTSNRPYAEQHGVEFQLARPCDAWAQVDAMRLQQVLANYLSNAAKFSPSGSTVEISAVRRGGRVRVTVSDSGPGIPAAFQSRIFQKFSQADASDSRSRGGSGLGLAITKQLVEQMGGEVGFDSGPELGSRFWFELPCISTPRDSDTA
jgi:PAS domain S-box-containing protein